MHLCQYCAQLLKGSAAHLSVNNGIVDRNDALEGKRDRDGECGHVTNQRHETVNNVTFRFSQDSRVSISIEHRFSNSGLNFEPYTLRTGDYFHKVCFINTDDNSQC